jgi:hypothetical protein
VNSKWLLKWSGGDTHWNKDDPTTRRECQVGCSCGHGHWHPPALLCACLEGMKCFPHYICDGFLGIWNSLFIICLFVLEIVIICIHVGILKSATFWSRIYSNSSKGRNKNGEEMWEASCCCLTLIHFHKKEDLFSFCCNTSRIFCFLHKEKQ